MRENRETPLLQAAIRIGAAFVVATVYLRHLLPVSDISFFITLRQSKPVQPRKVVRKDFHPLSCFVGQFAVDRFTQVRVFSTPLVLTKPLTEWSRGESNPCAVRISIRYHQCQIYLVDFIS